MSCVRLQVGALFDALWVGAEGRFVLCTALAFDAALHPCAGLAATAAVAGVCLGVDASAAICVAVGAGAAAFDAELAVFADVPARAAVDL